MDLIKGNLYQFKMLDRYIYLKAYSYQQTPLGYFDRPYHIYGRAVFMQHNDIFMSLTDGIKLIESAFYIYLLFNNAPYYCHMPTELDLGVHFTINPL